MTPLVLASASSARAGMLRAAGVEIEVAPVRLDEAEIRAAVHAEGAPPRDIADKLAEVKAIRASRRDPARMVLGADQVLVGPEGLHAKPATRDEARAQLRALRGQTHRLLSGAVIADAGIPVWRHVGTARPPMRPFTGTLHSSLTAGTNHDVSGSRGWAATAKPKTEGLTSVISANDAPPSVERNIPLWCWHHTTSGRALHCASRCAS